MVSRTNFTVVSGAKLPPSTNESQVTGWYYIFTALVDKPGQTWPSLAAGRPKHLSQGTIENLCYKLTTMGVLVKEGQGTTALFRPSRDAEKHIPEGWGYKGMPGAGQWDRNRGPNSKGFAAVARLPADQRAPLSPVKGKPVELADDIVKTPSGKFLVVKEPPPAAPAPPAPEVVKAVEAAYNGPMVMIMVGDKPRHYPVSVAKSIYKQLKEFFD